VGQYREHFQRICACHARDKPRGSARARTHTHTHTHTHSENYGTSNEALVARFYLNEAFYGSKMLAAACGKGDVAAAAEAWSLSRYWTKAV
jgi:hypothetical protein